MSTISQNAIAPRVDVYEDAKGFTIQAEMPGVRRENAFIEVEDGTLTLRGVRSAVNGNSRLHVRERARGEYRRSFEVGNGIDVGKVEARMDDGVLTISLPKAEKLQRKTISIN